MEKYFKINDLKSYILLKYIIILLKSLRSLRFEGYLSLSILLKT